MKSRSIPPVFLIAIVAVSLQVAVRAALPERLRDNDNHDFIRFYRPVGHNLLAGRGYVTETRESPFRYPPGYPLILAGIFAVSDRVGIGEEVALHSFTVFTTIAAALLIFHMARRPFGRSIAILAALAWLTYPFSLWDSKRYSSEQPFFVIFLGLVDLFAHAMEDPRPRSWRPLAIGMLVGAASLIRPIALALSAPLLALFWVVKKDWCARLKLAFGLGVVLGNLLIITPWEYSMWRKTGAILPLCDNGPVSAWEGVALTSCIRDYDGQPFPPLSADVVELMSEAESRRDEIRTTGQMGAFVLHAAAERPVTVAKLYALKAIRAWYATYTVRFEKLSAAIQFPYLVLAAWGLLVAWRRGGQPRTWATLTVLLVLYFWVMTLAVVSIVRYMMPVLSLLMIFVALAATSLCSAVKVNMPHRVPPAARVRSEIRGCDPTQPARP